MAKSSNSFKIGQHVKIIDIDEVYLNYVYMAEAMGITADWARGKSPRNEEEGIIVNIKRDSEKHDTILAAVKLRYGIIMICTNGIEKIDTIKKEIGDFIYEVAPASYRFTTNMIAKKITVIENKTVYRIVGPKQIEMTIAEIEAKLGIKNLKVIKG